MLRIPVRLVGMFVILVVAFLPQVTGATGAPTNGGFETGDFTGWTVSIWSPWGSSSTAVVLPHGAFSPQYGSYFAEMRAPYDATESLTSSPFTAAAGDSISGYSYVGAMEGGQEGARAEIDILSGNSIINTPFLSYQPTYAWQRWSYTFTTAGTYQVRAQAASPGGEGNVDTRMLLDEVTLHRAAPAYAATLLQPLDPSTTAMTIANKAKLGRVIPVKLEIADGSTEYMDVTAPPTIEVVKTTCNTSLPADPVETYADAGNTSAGTNQFRWSTEAPGYWIYNLDTKALGLMRGNCYRIDAYVGTNKVTNGQWAVIEITK